MEQSQNDAKTRILLASKKLFALNGYDGTSVRQICEVANTNAALISYYFGGKENVYHALFEIYSPINILAQEENISPVDGISSIVKKMTEYRIEESEMVSIIQQEIFMNSSRIENYKKYISEIWLTLKYYLNEGKAQGIFHFDSIDKALIYIIAIITFPNRFPNLGYIFADEDLNEEDAVNDTIHFILRGLGYSTDNCEVDNK